MSFELNLVFLGFFGVFFNKKSKLDIQKEVQRALLRCFFFVFLPFRGSSSK